jgi:hypothetical protein
VSSAAALYTGAKPPARSGSPTVTMAIAPTVRLSSFDTLLVAGTCRGDGERDGLGARQRTCASGRRAPLELHVSRAEVDNAEPDCARLHALGPCSRGLDQPRWDPPGGFALGERLAPQTGIRRSFGNSPASSYRATRLFLIMSRPCRAPAGARAKGARDRVTADRWDRPGF